MAITFGIGSVFFAGMYYVKKEKEKGMYMYYKDLAD